MKIANYKIKLASATWIDVNTNFTVDNLPDRLPDHLAISHCSLYNLLNCFPGQRARIFEPTYGSMWLAFIHEPINDLTASKMEKMMVDAIDRWVPQIEVDTRGTRVSADTGIPGYRVRISFFTPFAVDPNNISFEVGV